MNFKISFIITITFILAAKAMYADPSSLPEFELLGTNGLTYRSEDLKAKKIVCLVMLSNHCKISQRFEYLINEISEKMKQNDSILIAISPNNENAIIPDELAYSEVGDSYEEMKIRSINNRYTFPYLYDGEKQVVAKQLGSKSTPHGYLFDRKRKLVFSGKIGDYNKPTDIKESDLFKKYLDCLNDEDPKITHTKVHGTSIKFTEDIFMADRIKKRYANETVTLRYIDEKTLKFFIEHLKGSPTIFHIWSSSVNGFRQNLIELSSIYKIFRKRGFRLLTICVDPDKTETEIKTQLERAQLSAVNLCLKGSEVGSLMKFVPIESKSTVPFTILFGNEGNHLYSTVGGIDTLRCKKLIVNELGE